MDKDARRLRRKKGIRKKIHGTAEIPRVTVYKSNKHIYVQAIDDDNGKTLLSASDIEGKATNNRKGAHTVGVLTAQKIKAKKITRVIFDRNGYIYHGVVKSLADGIREGGVTV
jgi:large subunit ribosomal protein L18